MMSDSAAAASAATVLQYIDTAIGIATFLISERLPATVENIRAFFARKNVEKPADFDPEEEKNLVAALMKIDPKILGVLNKKVKSAIDSYVDCIDQASTVEESEACDRRAGRSLCDTLNRIMDKNMGALPSDYLNNQWDSFKCVRV